MKNIFRDIELWLYKYSGKGSVEMEWHVHGMTADDWRNAACEPRGGSNSGDWAIYKWTSVPLMHVNAGFTPLTGRFRASHPVR
jgi:hypothetical protein